MRKYLIGIDLGTTNCTMAYSPLDKEEGINTLLIPQMTAPGIQSQLSTLPSFLYFPLSEERQSGITGISWNPSGEICIGAFAQKRGAEIPSRLISSAKSWLCHSGINRREAILPLSSEEDLIKISPLNACAELLKHLREAWDKSMEVEFKNQQIFITVPASFDPSAIQLVQEAAEIASYPEVILLEEPQAAFYAWISNHEDVWRKILKVGDCVLVIDIGGGTTDFSLIIVGEKEGRLDLERLAVGSHLLLGGDNIDLSLAYLSKNKLEEQGHSIDDWQLQSLVHSCRQAKELLMNENAPQQVDITVVGRGSRLIGGTLKTQISLDEARSMILDGFAPLVSPDERALNERRSGLQQVGLPYAQDARFSCQLAKFLSMTGESDRQGSEQFIMPTAVLFNGGTTKAAALRERLVLQLNQWAKVFNKPLVQVLPDVDYDFAVSRGAVYYGKAREGKGIRIKSGTSRSYYIGVEDALPAVPGLAPALRAVCIAPFGMEEGSEQQLQQQEFSLVVGEQAIFRFFSHATPRLSDGIEPSIGTVVRKWRDELTELHPIETLLEKREGDGKMIRVKIKTRVTELGVLEVWCVAADGRKWKLEFDIRK